ncbi:MAG: DNA mismatch repair protein MutS [Betaproteobacteria bacterium]|nr:DNA mismatch repair protein MutS [Betaproteobacteria bacterium]NBT09490.1 DNA mismatch repair protein MutS [Betaproteobacteria bacterium]NBU49538.1 DNA mismatch repair protein MutS [Betaproteobacteria bacterium]NBX97194.1 DNA mismatch repair protein MutS [Betaproteobacteria bacterium]
MSTTPRLRLSDLASLKRQIERERHEALARQQREQEARLKAERERHLFRLSVGDITPLNDAGKVLLQAPAPEPVPRQRELDEQAALEEALSDEMDVETLLETDEGLSFRRRHIGQDVVRRLRRGQWAIQSQVDLHGLRRDEAREALQSFLRLSRRLGHRCVRVVHGKGLGSPGKSPVLKSRVRAWLIQSRAVLAFVQARASQGGHGAVIVLLAPPEDPRHAGP